MKHELTMTRRILDAMGDEPTNAAIFEALGRFYCGDWGTVPPEDKAANDADVAAGGGRVLARYETPKGDIYITSYPGTDTPPAVLFCDEY